MNPKEKDDEIIELTDEELDEIFADDDFDSGEDGGEIRSFYFSILTRMPRSSRAPTMPQEGVFFRRKGQHRGEESVRLLAARCQNRGGTRRHGIHRNWQL